MAAVHPGVIQTELGRHLTPDLTKSMLDAAKTRQLVYKSVAQGAATSVWCAAKANADEIGGRYCEDCHVREINPELGTKPGGVKPYAVDPARAEALWAKSEALVGERFG